MIKYILIIVFIIILYFTHKKTKEHFTVTGTVVIDGERAFDPSIPSINLLNNNDTKKFQYKSILKFLHDNQVLNTNETNTVMEAIEKL